jgi:hypothetical protein
MYNWIPDALARTRKMIFFSFLKTAKLEKIACMVPVNWSD